MSTLWTPDGEHKPKNTKNSEQISESPSKEEELAAQQRLDNIREQLANSDAKELIANHCYGLFELAAIYLSQSPPKLEEASLSIDALQGIVSATKGRLGSNEQTIFEGLHQLQLAFVQVSVLKQGGDKETQDTAKDSPQDDS